MQVIPVPKNVPSLRQSRVLDGTEYELRLVWNMRAGWFLGLNDEAGEPIFHLRALTVGNDLLASVRYDARCPPGVLVALDATGTQAEPGYLDLVAGSSSNDLQGTVALVYIPRNEL